MGNAGSTHATCNLSRAHKRRWASRTLVLYFYHTSSRRSLSQQYAVLYMVPVAMTDLHAIFDQFLDCELSKTRRQNVVDFISAAHGHHYHYYYLSCIIQKNTSKPLTSIDPRYFCQQVYQRAHLTILSPSKAFQPSRKTRRDIPERKKNHRKNPNHSNGSALPSQTDRQTKEKNKKETIINLYL